MVVRVLLAGFEGRAAGVGRPPGAAVDAATRLLAESSRKEAAAGAAGEGVAQGVRLEVLLLPCAYGRAAERVQAALREGAYDDFVLVGTDAASSEHKLHVFAANFADDPEPDADGLVLKETIIDPDGPVAYRSRLPLDGIWDKFLVERVPVRMSHKAPLGLFNHTYYAAMRAIDRHGLATRGGAVEMPPLPGQAVEDATPRPLDALEDELLMLLSVLAQLHPAAPDAPR